MIFPDINIENQDHFLLIKKNSCFHIELRIRTTTNQINYSKDLEHRDSNMYKGIIFKLIIDDLVLSTSKYVFLFIIKVQKKVKKM